jgi:hypothetical protein
MVESQAQLNPDGVGKKVRTLEVLTTLTGVQTLVECQVVALMGPDGDLMGDLATKATQLEIIEELRALRRLLARAYNLAEFVPETPQALR